MRYLTFAALLVFATTLARADEWQHNYPVTGKPEIFVDANDGDVEVAMASSQQVGVRVIAHGWKII